MSSDPHILFEQYLITVDSRYTQQKRRICNVIFSKKDHFEIENFILELRTKNIEFSRATLYRTLKQLLDANLIQKVTTKEGKVFYEQSIEEGQHDHIICNNCGKIYEITGDEINTYLAKFCSRIKFTPQYRSLHLYGLCSSCSH